MNYELENIKQSLQKLKKDELIKLIELMGYGTLKYEGNCIKGSIDFIIDSKDNVRIGKK